MTASDVRHLLLLAVVAFAMLVFGWVGFVGSQDAAYADAAQRWLEGGSGLAPSHWEMRYLYVGAIGVAFALFGATETALLLPGVIAYLILVGLTYLALRVLVDRHVALLAGVFVAALPLFAAGASVATPDTMELVFVAASLLLLADSENRGRTRGWFVAVGVLAGFAWLVRETSAGLIVFFLLLLFAGDHTRRARVGWVLLGFVIVAGAEFVNYFAATGDALYRLRADFGAGDLLGRGGVAEASADRVSALVVGSWLDPVLALFAGQEFSALYWLAMPVGLWLVFDRRLAAQSRRLVRYLAAAGLIQLLLVVALTGQRYLLPRYLYWGAFAATLLLAIGVVTLWRRGSRGLAFAIAAAYLAGCAAGVYVDNREYFFGERAVVGLAADSDEPLYTDPETFHRIEFLLEAAGVAARVRTEPPPPGARFAYLRRNVDRGVAAGVRFDSAQYRPQTAWEELARFDPGRKWIGQMIATLGLRDALPSVVYRRLNRPTRPMIVYRVVVEPLTGA